MKIGKILEGDKLYFMSDLHYGHANIIKHDSRSFKDVEEMNSSILKELKSIPPGSTVIDLGDMFWKTSTEDILEVLSVIPDDVEIYKVIGNHDSYGLFSLPSKVSGSFVNCCDSLDIRVRYDGVDYQASLSHFPMISWNHKPYGSFMLHGHCHGNIDDFNNSSNDLRVDVGYNGGLVKKVGSFLIPFSSIISHFKEKTGGIEFRKWVLENCKEL